MKEFETFLKRFDRTPHKSSGNMATFRNIQELDLEVERATKILKDLDLEYSIKKHPILRGFSVTIKDGGV